MNVLALFAQTNSYFDISTPDIAKFLGLSLGILVVIGIVLAIMFIFWVLMLAHAVQNDSQYKYIWIIILLVSFFLGLGLFGALFYLFLEKPRVDEEKRRRPTPDI